MITGSNKIVKIICFSLVIVFCYSCRKQSFFRYYKTENVIVVVIDGPRYTETWGDTTHKYIPCISKMLTKEGISNTQFFNNGPTYTVAGHTSITTGIYQDIANDGTELPRFPSIFQYFRKGHFYSPLSSWIITSKDKLEVLDNCQYINWKNNYLPGVNCGISGLGSGYREDSLTFDQVISVLSNYHPKFVIINFMEPDFSAHTGSWNAYLMGIKSSDTLTYRIWDFVQQDTYYKNKTTLIVTSDHGRHSDGVADGFVSHGDTCQGCRHVNFFAFGPDFIKGTTNTKRELIDISKTIAELLNFNTYYGNGQIMNELFIEK